MTTDRELAKWVRRNKTKLRSALWMAESWETTGADAALGNQMMGHTPTKEQRLVARRYRASADRFRQLNKELYELLTKRKQ